MEEWQGVNRPRGWVGAKKELNHTDTITIFHPKNQAK